MALPPPDRSALLLDEYYNAEDPRFLEQFRQVGHPLKLAGLAERWKKDPRPWVRQQQHAAHRTERFAGTDPLRRAGIGAA